jgi:hypothetical protein
MRHLLRAAAYACARAMWSLVPVRGVLGDVEARGEQTLLSHVPPRCGRGCARALVNSAAL